ncbi:hypothetical protein TNCV_318741 [Trichonephila clavipes]|nr:hypothetical protein TNCV_318741 [Trichonephila clavipes]
MFGFAVCVQYACPVSHCQGQMSLAHHPYTVDLENLSGFTHLRFVRDRRHNGNSEKPQLYEIGATFKRSPEDTVTLYRDYQLTLCRKTNK